MKKRCRHCRVKKANRPRQLCWGCYYTPGVRDRYAPSAHSGAVRSGVPTISVSPRPAAPTDAPPGSAAKMAVMRERAGRGEALAHPDDAEGCRDGGVIWVEPDDRGPRVRRLWLDGRRELLS